MRVRLREFNNIDDLKYGAKWYQNPRVLVGSEGKHIKCYDIETVKRMYKNLKVIGDVYIIEYFFDEVWIAVGDITLSQNMLPIVIGDDRFVGQGIGKRALKLLIEIARFKQYEKLIVSKVFAYNINSQKLYESLGFIKKEQYTDTHGVLCFSYELIL
ncbi:GNAT family N-acetyltransferase [Macrococcoides canis]|uniref:GNAT family N-acetyltransferase n=1 Tax=Macrococcoides canis TaxID=1855823 RepID=A0AAE7C026_9STAP|nr:GNAT family N-acetyltransferase [Macrococcus canis]QCT74785.1 GNAT family N-acetyltransferase [Macrococcus canis]QIH78388.1 GNAT family N-acetyltransferase [Macrococcus canis]QNR07886.1 GNAT family N-acetyltransferase [Macrococcus canis]